MRSPLIRSSAEGSKTPCCSKVGLKRGPWTPEEDELLSSYIERAGEGRWRTLPKHAGLLRCGKSCRLRWVNYLRPSVKRGRIAADEEDLILRLHRLLGNRWALIAGRIPGRTDNEIKNYWNTHLSKKLISQGIDPRNHKQLYPNPNPNPPVIASSATPCPNPSPNPINNPNCPITGSSTTPNQDPCPEPSPTPNPNPNIPVNIPSTAPNQNPHPNPNPTPPPNFSGFEQPGVCCNQSLFIKTSDQYQKDLAGGSSIGNLQNFDGLMMGLEDDIGRYCNDDPFTSFLNSLINEDGFGNQQPNNMVGPSSSTQQPVSSFMHTFVYGNSVTWEAAELTPTVAALGYELNGLSNYMG